MKVHALHLLAPAAGPLLLADLLQLVICKNKDAVPIIHIERVVNNPNSRLHVMIGRFDGRMQARRKPQLGDVVAKVHLALRRLGLATSVFSSVKGRRVGSLPFHGSPLFGRWLHRHSCRELVVVAEEKDGRANCIYI